MATVKERYNRLAMPGDCKFSYIAVDHYGWLLLDGRKLKQADYPVLFKNLGVTAATITLPDASGRVLMATDAANKAGATGGDTKLTLTLDNLPAHKHATQKVSVAPTQSQGALLTSVLNIALGQITKPPTTKVEDGGESGPSGGGKDVALPKPPFFALNAFIFGG